MSENLGGGGGGGGQEKVRAGPKFGGAYATPAPNIVLMFTST